MQAATKSERMMGNERSYCRLRRLQRSNFSMTLPTTFLAPLDHSCPFQARRR